MSSDLRRAYAILNLSPPITHDVLKHRYRELTKRWHPDRYASDPIGQTEATQRMREINDAYRVVAASLEASEQIDGRPASPEPVPGLSRENIHPIIDSINRSYAWWPSMTPSRWLSVFTLMLYLVSSTAILSGEAAGNRAVARAFGQAVAYFFLPMYFIWSAEAEDKPREWRVLCSTVGWILMVAPALVGVVLWAGYWKD